MPFFNEQNNWQQKSLNNSDTYNKEKRENNLRQAHHRAGHC